jgi:AraC-like DNA-binding protein
LGVRLNQILKDYKPYLDAGISPEYFSERLGISRHNFSQLLSEGLGTTFYDLINFHRIEFAKVYLRDAKYDNAKILHIAFDSGFSNKSTFIRNFKKLTGQTPSEYRTSTQNRVPGN